MSNHTATCWTSSASLSAPRPSWAAEMDPLTEFLDLSAGENHVCGLRPNGTISCYGGTRAAPAGGFGFTTVSAGNGIACGVTRPSPDNTSGGREILCWSDAPGHPLLSGIPRGPWLDVSLGDAHACSLSCNGTVTCWGSPRGWEGFDFSGDYIFLAAGGNNTCAISSSHDIACNTLTILPSASPDPGKLTREIAAGGVGVATIAGSHGRRVWFSANTTVCSIPPSLPSPTPDIYWNALATSANGLFLAAAANEGLFTSTDAGATWTQRLPSLQGFVAVTCSSDGMRLMAALGSGSLYQSTDGVVVWARRATLTYVLRSYDSQLPAPRASLASSHDGLRIVAAIRGGRLYTSAGGGQAFTPREQNRLWRAVASSGDGLRLLAAENSDRDVSAEGGQLYLSSDGGLSWTPREPPRMWLSVASSADGVRLVAVSLSQIYVSSDGGETWAARETDRGWISVASSWDGVRLIAATRGYQLYRSNDGGSSWKAVDDNRDWRVVVSNADGTRIAAAVSTNENGPLYASADSGSSFGRISVSTHIVSAPGLSFAPRAAAGSWSSVACSADGMRIVAASVDDRLYTSSDGGVTFTARDSARNWVAVASSRDGMRLLAAVGETAVANTIYGYGIRGQLYISDDGGVNWAPKESMRSWSSVACSADGMRIVAAAIGDRLYTSSDGGAVFTPRDAVRNWVSVASSLDGMRLAAAVEGGLLYTSSDGGVLWSPRDAVRAWAAIASSADGMRLFATASSQLYTSTDAGLNWTMMEGAPPLPRVAASADGMRLIATSSLPRLYTSFDGGLNWAPLLPAPSREWAVVAINDAGTVFITATRQADARIYIANASTCTIASIAAASVATALRLPVVDADAVVTPRHITLSSGAELYTARIPYLAKALGPFSFSGWPRALSSLLLSSQDFLPPNRFSGQGCMQNAVSFLAVVNGSGRAMQVASSAFDGLSGLRTLSCRGAGMYSTLPGILSVDVLPAARLAFLDLAENRLFSLIGRATSRVLDTDAVVDLSANYFNDTSTLVPALSSLQAQVTGVHTSLADNSLLIVPPRAFTRGFESVVSLDLRNNGIVSMADTAFDEVGNANLAELSLSGNALGVVCRPRNFNRLVSFRNRLETTFSFAACALCAVGSYCPGDGRVYECPPGLFSNVIAASSNATCSPCPLGTYNELYGRSRIGCVSCSPGYTSSVVASASATTCAACGAGYFAGVPGQSSCTPCPAGTYAATQSDGVMRDAQATACTACPLGTYSGKLAALNASTCVPCAGGAATLQEGATSVGACVTNACPAGKYAVVNGSGMAGAAIVLVLAWRADNAVYVSTLRPLLPDFGWSDISVPLEFTLGFAADELGACDSVRLLSAAPADSTALAASAFRFATAETAAASTTGDTRQAVLCSVRLQWQAFAPASVSGLLFNITLQLPSSAQSVGWSAAGLLTPSAASVDLNAAAAVETGTLEPPLDSLGMRSGRIRMSRMPLLEEDKIAPLTSNGLLVVAVSSSLQERASSEILPGDDGSSVNVEVVAEPVQQFLHISVTQRSSVAQLLASAAGLLSGLGVVFRLAYVAVYTLAQKRHRGQPPWEREALAARRAAEAEACPAEHDGGSTSPTAAGASENSLRAVSALRSFQRQVTAKNRHVQPQPASSAGASSPHIDALVTSGGGPLVSPSANTVNPMAAATSRRAASQPVAVPR